jgi:hypothetical protein
MNGAIRFGSAAAFYVTAITPRERSALPGEERRRRTAMKNILATAAIALGLAGAGAASAAMPQLGAAEAAKPDASAALTLVAGGCGPYAFRNGYGYCQAYGSGGYYHRHYNHHAHGYHNPYPAYPAYRPVYRPYYPVVPVIVPRFNFWIRF